MKRLRSLFGQAIRAFGSVFLLLASLTVSQAATPSAVEAAPPRSVALVVANNAGAAFDPAAAGFQDLVTGRIADLGLRFVNRDVVLGSLGAVDAAGPQATAAGKALDVTLSDQSTALRLAQTLGADYLLVVSFSNYGEKSRAVDTYGVKFNTVDRSLLVSYRLLDASQGASVTADSVRVSTQSRSSANAAEVDGTAQQELLVQASDRVAESLRTKIGQGRLVEAGKALAPVKVEIRCELADLAIPDVRLEGDNTVAISESKLKVGALAVNVEVNGILVGTAPGTFEVPAGLNRIRLTREGFQPWERTVNFHAGQKLVAPISLSEAGLVRWRQTTEFLNELKNGAKLTDAEVKVLEGKAKMLEQSGFKVDTDEAVEIKNQSLFQ